MRAARTIGLASAAIGGLLVVASAATIVDDLVRRDGTYAGLFALFPLAGGALFVGIGAVVFALDERRRGGDAMPTLRVRALQTLTVSGVATILGVGSCAAITVFAWFVIAPGLLGVLVGAALFLAARKR